MTAEANETFWLWIQIYRRVLANTFMGTQSVVELLAAYDGLVVNTFNAIVEYRLGRENWNYVMQIGYAIDTVCKRFDY